jgi:Protein DA1
MKLRYLILWLAFLGLAGVAGAEELRCAVCGQSIVSNYHYMTDALTGEKKNLCLTCSALKDHCYICGLPVKENFQRLPDGRVLCERDAADAVGSESQAKEICSRVTYDIDRQFSRFMTFPDTNVEVSIVDKFHLENLFHAPGYQDSCVSTEGATASNPQPNGKYYHTVDLLSYMRKSRLMAVCAHEYTHAWMHENVSAKRLNALDRNTIEGFCELIAYKYMESEQETQELGCIKRNTYTRGQVDAFVEADHQYGFNAVVEWLKSGEDSRLDLANLDRVRAVDGGTYVRHAAPVAKAYDVPRGVAMAAPSTLELKGISGTENHRFAMINNATFEPLEKGKVRIGETNVTVQCLEIRSSSVVIQVDGSGEKKELFLTGK